MVLVPQLAGGVSLENLVGLSGLVFSNGKWGRVVGFT